MELQRDAIRAMLRAAYDAGLATADQVTPVGARRQLRDNWLDDFTSKLGGSPQAPTDDLSVQLDNVRELTLLVSRLVPEPLIGEFRQQLHNKRKLVEQDAKRVQH